jgi:hypothetical protein
MEAWPRQLRSRQRRGQVPRPPLQRPRFQQLTSYSTLESSILYSRHPMNFNTCASQMPSMPAPSCLSSPWRLSSPDSGVDRAPSPSESSPATTIHRVPRALSSLMSLTSSLLTSDVGTWRLSLTGSTVPAQVRTPSTSICFKSLMSGPRMAERNESLL